MSIDNEILQEFLVEAGELFDQLNDQFVELEKNPDDIDIINAIFRAYHTIKGGAGFMKLIPMVEVCHRAEDAINQLRQGERQVTDELVDVMFQVLDELDDMFSCVRAGDELADANADLLQQLDKLLASSTTQDVSQQVEASNMPAGETKVAVASTDTSTDANITSPAEQNMDDEFEAMLEASSNATANKAVNDSDLISDDEFDSVLDQLHGKGKHKVITTDPGLISDDEFDAVLDKLHGEGKHGSVTEKIKQPDSKELITDDEFEAVLDHLHGQGKGPRSDENQTTHKDVGSAENAGATYPPTHKDVGSAENAGAIFPPTTVNTQSVNNNTLPIETKNTSETSDSLENAATGKTVTRKKAVDKPQAETSVRVDTTRLDHIMNLVGELVLVRNRLTTLKHEIKNNSLSDAISTLELVSSELQSSIMKTRMQPIKKVFSRFPRVIRDLARKLNKDINLELIGEETDLDKSLVEALADPLIHLVRNAADHGIESPEERFESGKPRQGTVTLCAQQEGDQILLTVTDDGKGMDHNVLRRKAVEKGMMSEDVASKLTDKEAYNLIFAAGFSTKTEVSDVSGRGVGMDVVKTRINELNGNVEIDSTQGKGSVISIYLPLTLAILPTLMVRLNQYQFALPLSNVIEAFNMQPDQINIIDGDEVIRVRDNPLPLYYLNPWLVRGGNFDGPKESQKVIVVQMGNQRFCMVVDHIAGQEEVVIKPLGRMLTNTRGFSGATITGDGSIALILDVPSLLVAYAANSAIC